MSENVKQYNSLCRLVQKECQERINMIKTQTQFYEDEFIESSQKKINNINNQDQIYQSKLKQLKNLKEKFTEQKEKNEKLHNNVRDLNSNIDIKVKKISDMSNQYLRGCGNDNNIDDMMQNIEQLSEHNQQIQRDQKKELENTKDQNDYRLHDQQILQLNHTVNLLQVRLNNKKNQLNRIFLQLHNIENHELIRNIENPLQIELLNFQNQEYPDFNQSIRDISAIKNDLNDTRQQLTQFVDQFNEQVQQYNLREVLQDYINEKDQLDNLNKDLTVSLREKQDQYTNQQQQIEQLIKQLRDLKDEYGNKIAEYEDLLDNNIDEIGQITRKFYDNANTLTQSKTLMEQVQQQFEQRFDFQQKINDIADILNIYELNNEMQPKEQMEYITKQQIDKLNQALGEIAM